RGGDRSRTWRGGRVRGQRGRRPVARRCDPEPRSGGSTGMSHPRHTEPLPLGSPHQPYSKGLMARALVAVGVPLGRAYELAKRIDQDLAQRREQSVELERVEELAVEVLGEEEGSEAVRRLRRYGGLREVGLPIIRVVGGAG